MWEKKKGRGKKVPSQDSEITISKAAHMVISKLGMFPCKLRMPGVLSGSC